MFQLIIIHEKSDKCPPRKDDVHRILQTGVQKTPLRGVVISAENETAALANTEKIPGLLEKKLIFFQNDDRLKRNKQLS